MNNTFFDETGLLNIDDIILQQPSFQKIMADGIITEEELTEQSNRVIAILKSLERNLSSEQVEKVRELLAEISVLIATRAMYNNPKLF